jgi:hypothetical protein
MKQGVVVHNAIMQRIFVPCATIPRLNFPEGTVQAYVEGRTRFRQQKAEIS